MDIHGTLSIPIIQYSDPKVTAWFTAAMDGIACTLARHPLNSAVSRFVKPHLLEESKRDKDAEQTELSLTNESPFLLISERSVEDVRERIGERRVECGEGDGGEEVAEIEASGFRANIVVRGMQKAYEEDEWKTIRIGGQVFKVSNWMDCFYERDCCGRECQGRPVWSQWSLKIRGKE